MHPRRGDGLIGPKGPRMRIFQPPASCECRAYRVRLILRYASLLHQYGRKVVYGPLILFEYFHCAASRFNRELPNHALVIVGQLQRIKFETMASQ